MKLIVLISSIFISVSAFSSTLKTCNSVLAIGGEEAVPTKFELEDDNFARITQKVDGREISYTDSYTAGVFEVRSGLTKDTDPEGLNRAEALIVHAMMLESDPIFENLYRSGVNLKKVRGAWVFTIGETSNMGSTSIIEARDAKGRTLGSFLGGFVLSPCK